METGCWTRSVAWSSVATFMFFCSLCFICSWCSFLHWCWYMLEVKGFVWFLHLRCQRDRPAHSFFSTDMLVSLRVDCCSQGNLPSFQLTPPLCLLFICIHDSRTCFPASPFILDELVNLEYYFWYILSKMEFVIIKDSGEFTKREGYVDSVSWAAMQIPLCNLHSAFSQCKL